jgi:hypothetical protein
MQAGVLQNRRRAASIGQARAGFIRAIMFKTQENREEAMPHTMVPVIAWSMLPFIAGTAKGSA